MSDQIRKIILKPSVIREADGSVSLEMGNTKVKLNMKAKKYNKGDCMRIWTKRFIY